MDPDTMDKLISSTSLLTEQLSNLQDENAKSNCVQDYLRTIKLPNLSCDFPKGAEWFNVSERLSLNDLRGKVIVLDFFTYCCINCMHVLPDLRALEEEFRVEDGVVVVGVHSAKFENEKQSQNILSAVQRYSITHPVVNDANAEFWNNLNICCWPTLLILAPDLQPLFVLMGEGHRDNLFLFINNTLEYYKRENNVKTGTLPILSEWNIPESTLRFPGKITCWGNDLIGISDSGNNRVLVVRDGKVEHVVGGNGPGFKDGNFKDALFSGPQGLVFESDDVLYVADTENHAIRKVNLKFGTVSTVAGDGNQGTDRLGGKYGPEQQLSSPWDLSIYLTPDLDLSFHNPNEPIMSKKKVLLIAMAGTHQIWALFLEDFIWWKFKKYTTGTCVAIAGSGREENRNNLYPHAAAFAQPSGISLDIENKDLYVADSESSSIRRISLVDGKVTGVVGGNRSPTNLFDFGDLDGTGYDAKLQHPLDVAVSPTSGHIYVADSYNHKIKRIDANTNSITTLGKLQFNEPGGLCVTQNGKQLYIADTNNHAIKVIDLTKKLNCSTLHLQLPPDSINNNHDIMEVSHLGANGVFNFSFNFNDVELTKNAPNSIRVSSMSEGVKILQGDFGDPIKIELPKQVDEVVEIKVNVVICFRNVCKPLSLVTGVNFKGVPKGVTSFTKDFKFKVTEKNIQIC